MIYGGPNYYVLSTGIAMFSNIIPVCMARKPQLLRVTPSPPTKSLDFRGFDSSRLLILRGGNSHVRMNV